MDRDSVLASFVEVTGAGHEQAARMLEATAWDLEQAVALHFAADGAVGDSGGAAASADFPAAVPDEEPVRAPIESFQDTLTGAAGAAAQNIRIDAENVARVSERAFGGSGGRSRKQDRLNDLFRPPTDIMFSGTFREAEDEAKRSDKLILACVLDNSEFDSHRMVRDTWKDENVKNFVRDNVVFLMFYRDTSAGATFLSFYPAMEFPYTALVDASTGELAQDWTGFVEPDVLLARISDVVISRSIEASSGAAVRSSVQPDPTGSSSRGSSGHDEDMELDGTDTDLLAQASAYGDDDEALAKAIAASLQDQDAEDLVADRQRADDSGSLGIVGDGKDDAGFRYRVQPRRKRRNAPKPSRTETGAGDEVLARALETREIRMEQDRALREAMEQDRKRDEERAAAAAQAAAAQEERERAAREEAEAREREARAETEAREREAREQAARAKEASAALPPEPDATVEGVVDIAIRLPSGERIRRRFAADHKIGDVLAFAASHGHSVAGRELVTPHPITRFSDPNVRIEDAQLGSRALLILREAP